MCRPCKANVENNITQGIIKPATTDNCGTTLTFLNYLNNLIDLNVYNSATSTDDKNLLQVYKGQVQSGINLTNYCYIDYNVVETNIYNVISKYT